MVIAIDFDGTIVEDNYPEIGDPKIFAFETLREMQKKRYQLLLWTTREGDELEEAVEFCRKNGVEFYAVNNSYPEEKFDDVSASRKLNCEVFISHKNIGGVEGWGEIFQELKSLGGENELYDQLPQKTSFFDKVAKMIWK
ncbi:MAG: BT0820 family HAD-type phosphatase [Salibacteraceae bacterium]